MTPPVSNQRNSQRDGQPGQILITTSSWLNLDRPKSQSAPEHSTTTKKNQATSLPSTTRVPRTPIPASKEHKKTMETAEIQQTYQNSYKNGSLISFALKSDVQEAQRRTITAFGDEMWAVLAVAIALTKSFGSNLFLRPDLISWKHGQTGLHISSFTSYGHYECTSTMAENSI